MLNAAEILSLEALDNFPRMAQYLRCRPSCKASGDACV